MAAMQSMTKYMMLLLKAPNKKRNPAADWVDLQPTSEPTPCEWDLPATKSTCLPLPLIFQEKLVTRLQQKLRHRNTPSNKRAPHMR